MKSLLWPWIAFLLVTVILVALLRELTIAPLPSDGFRLRLPENLQEPALPTSGHGDGNKPADIVVVLQHGGPTSCRPDCGALDHWMVQLRVRDTEDAKIRPFELCYADLQAELQKVIGRMPRTTKDQLMTETTLAIRAPATAPCGVVRVAVWAGVREGIQRVDVAVASAATVAKELRLSVHMPLDSADRALQDSGGIRVRLTRANTTGACEWQLVPWDGAPEEPHPGIPRLAWQEHAQFRLFVQKWLAQEHEPGVSAAIDAPPEVPLQSLVDLIGSFRTAGINQVTVLWQ